VDGLTNMDKKNACMVIINPYHTSALTFDCNKIIVYQLYKTKENEDAKSIPRSKGSGEDREAR
jgi:hypothetical protein